MVLLNTKKQNNWSINFEIDKNLRSSQINRCSISNGLVTIHSVDTTIIIQKMASVMPGRCQGLILCKKEIFS